MSKFGNLLNVRTCLGQSSKDSSNVSSILHGNDSQLVFLIHPHKESLLIVVEDASSLRPISIKTTSFKESITLFKKEMIFD